MRQPAALFEALKDRRNGFDHTAYQIANVQPLVTLFRGRIRHYVFTSSQAVYRRSLVLPIREDCRRHAPDHVARRHPPVLHWGEALVGSSFMSIEAAVADTGWQPRFDIEDGYRDAWTW